MGPPETPLERHNIIVSRGLGGPWIGPPLCRDALASRTAYVWFLSSLAPGCFSAKKIRRVIEKLVSVLAKFFCSLIRLFSIVFGEYLFKLFNADIFKVLKYYFCGPLQVYVSINLIQSVYAIIS